MYVAQIFAPEVLCRSDVRTRRSEHSGHVRPRPHVSRRALPARPRARDAARLPHGATLAVAGVCVSACARTAVADTMGGGGARGGFGANVRAAASRLDLYRRIPKVRCDASMRIACCSQLSGDGIASSRFLGW